MRLHDDFRKCVVFFGSESGAKFTALGVGFLLSDDKYRCNYLVTAEHVATAARNNGHSLRVNTRGGGSICRPAEIAWETDTANDVAVALYNAPENADVRYVPHHLLLDDDRRSLKFVETGSPAYIVGHFPYHAGERKNISVVHTGHIALLPGDEPVGTRNLLAYLVQIQALPGTSGAPVFIKRPVKTLPLPAPFEDTGVFPEAYGAPFILGLWHGSWKAEPDPVLAESFDIDSHEIVVPTSFGIVIPAQRIIDLLNAEPMKSMREKAKLQERSRNDPSLDLRMAPGSTGKQIDDRMKSMLQPILKKPRRKKRGNMATRKPKR